MESNVLEDGRTGSNSYLPSNYNWYMLLNNPVSKPLTEAEERLIVQSVADGSASARQELIYRNLRLVISIASRYSQLTGIPIMDLIQEGNIGLMNAVKRFNPDRQIRFSTYATHAVRRRIIKSANELSRMISIPEYLLGDLWRVNKFIDRIFNEMGGFPTPKEISEELGISLDKVTELLNLPKEPIPFGSLIKGSDVIESVPNGNEDDEGIVDYGVYEVYGKYSNGYTGNSNDSIKDPSLIEAFSKLSVREKLVISLRYGIGGEGSEMSLREAGEYLGLSYEGVRVIEKRAIKKLKEHFSKT